MKKRAVMAVVLAIAAHWHSQSLAQSGALISNSDFVEGEREPGDSPDYAAAAL